MRGYKWVRVLPNGRMVSVMIAPSSPLSLRYSTDDDTRPAVGYCMVFGSLRSAKDFISDPEMFAAELWECDYDPAPRRVPVRIPCYSDDESRIERFWRSFMNRNSVMFKALARMARPTGTHFATRVRLVKRID